MRWPLQRARAKARAASLPPGRRIYAFGDVHGQAALLERLLASIAEHVAERPAAETLLIGLGDFVDRGDASRVLDLLSTAALPCGAHRWLRGNHEALLLAAAETDDADSFLNWMRAGGRDTVRSYGVCVPAKLAEPSEALKVRRDWLRAMPPAHLRLLRSTRLHHTEAPYTFVHAGIRPGVPLEQQTRDDLLWIREPFFSEDRDFGTVVVHGHTPHAQVENKRNRINVDTGAYATGILSAVVLEGDTREFLSTGDG